MLDVSQRLDAGRELTILAGDGVFAVPGSPRPSDKTVENTVVIPSHDGVWDN
jgi:hypothetical protein